MVMQRPLATLVALLGATAVEALRDEYYSPTTQLRQAPVAAPADAYPQLPPVAAMLGTASETMRSISVQADSLQKRMMEAQAQNQAKMARQKEIFEQKLKGQEEANRAVVSANAEITKEINALKGGNAGLRKNAKELRAGNHLMRDELRELENKLGVARAFIAQSLVTTDDSHAKDLQVLSSNEVMPMPQMQQQQQRRKASEKDDDDDEDDEEDGESFLAVASKVTHVGGADDEVDDTLAAANAPPQQTNPRDLLSVLSHGIESLSQEEKASEAKLRSLFLQQYQSGARRHAGLIAQQKQLIAMRAALKALQGKLRIAEAHLEDTKARLGQRLTGVGHFMQKLSHLALAPAGEASRLMEALPAAVTIPDAEKGHF